MRLEVIVVFFYDLPTTDSPEHQCVAHYRGGHYQGEGPSPHQVRPRHPPAGKMVGNHKKIFTLIYSSRRNIERRKEPCLNILEQIKNW